MFRSSKKVVLGQTDSGEEHFISTGIYTRGSNDIASSKLNMGKAFSKSTLSEMSVKEARQKQENKAATTVETASVVNGLPSNSLVNEVIIKQINDDVLEGFLALNNTDGVNRTLNKIYADMYYFDTICGSAVDLMAVLPFSDFSLTGIKDPVMLNRFQDSLENMNTSTLLPSIVVDHLVLGAFLGSTSWDETGKVFNSIVPHNIDLAKIKPVPVFGADPLIDLTIPADILATMVSGDSRLDEFKERIPDDLKTLLNAQQGKSSGRGAVGLIQLDPNATIFIPRRGLLRDYAGISLFKRAMPAWLIEKALTRGTIDQVYKRQRAALHVTVGNGQDFIATQAQMTEIAELFMNIDLDPVGALIVTRDGVSVNEVRRGDDFWKLSDSYDSLATMRFRAIGISESFITGDANWNTMDKTLSVMLETIKGLRALITRELFYNKVFPAIAQENNITRKRYSTQEVASAMRPNWYTSEDGSLVAEIAAAPSLRDFDPTKFIIPQVQWHKQLLPEADDAYMQLLNGLEEKGIPIPLRILAAAGGLRMDTLFDSMSADVKDRERLQKYKEAIKKFAPKEEDEGDMGEEASVNLTESGPTLLGHGSVIRRGLFSRGAAPDEIVKVQNTRSGRKTFTTKKGSAVLTERLHKEVAQAATKLAERENRKLKRSYTPDKVYSYNKG